MGEAACAVGSRAGSSTAAVTAAREQWREATAATHIMMAQAACRAHQQLAAMFGLHTLSLHKYTDSATWLGKAAWRPWRGSGPPASLPEALLESVSQSCMAIGGVKRVC